MKKQWAGALCFPFLVACGGGGGGSKSNQPPVMEDFSITVNEDSTVTVAIPATDPEQDPLSFQVITQPEKGTVVINGNQLSFSAVDDLNGADSFELRVSDGSNSLDKSVPVTISPINDAPRFVTAQKSFSGNEDSVISGTVAASDPDGDTVTYSIAQQPEQGQVSIGGDTFNFTPTANFHGNSSFVIQASDGVLSQNITVNLSVLPVNDPPVALASTVDLSVVTNASVSKLLSVSDIDDETLTPSLLQAPQNGSVTFDGLIVTYSPGSYIGSEQFVVRVADGAAAYVDITFNVQSRVPGEPPVLSANQQFVSPDGKEINGTIQASDPDSTNLIFSAPTQAITGQFNLQSNGSFTYRYTGSLSNPLTETIQVQVSDGGSTVQGEIVIRVLSDQLFNAQWHIKNTGQSAFSASSGVAGEDINIGDLHYQQSNGQGIFVAVVDSGLQLQHEDLDDNILQGRSRNYASSFTNDPSPTGSGGDHGTSVAGLIAAEAFNTVGGRGVAPNASIAGFNFLSYQSSFAFLDSHGGDSTADARVINQSFGSTPLSPVSFDYEGQDVLESHLASVMSNRNGGKGISFIKSAGNSFCRVLNTDELRFNGNTPQYIYCENVTGAPTQTKRLTANVAGVEPMSSSFYETVVSALNANGTLSSYSSVGASVWAAAPGGEYGVSSPAMVTTDVTGCLKGYAQTGSGGSFESGSYSSNSNCNYTARFNGTSSAAPVTSGVFALIYQANPNLSWRDARDIVARTADKIDSAFQPVAINNNGNLITAEPGWLRNAAGFDFHNWYGFGRINATEAVNLAKSSSYQKLPALKQTAFINASSTGLTIPEDNSLGVVKQITVTDNYTIEMLQLKISIEHGRDADLMIEVTSPSGTKSVIQTPRSLLVYDLADDYRSSSSRGDFDQTVLASNAFYGEPSLGTWTVRVIDTNSDNFRFRISSGFSTQLISRSNNSSPGTFGAAAIRFYGH